LDGQSGDEPIKFKAKSDRHRTAICEAGRSFSELPGDRHAVSANASETQPAKLLAVFVVDTNETELTIPLGK
jgi:quercetin dioxygenase-like cupin family protein